MASQRNGDGRSNKRASAAGIGARQQASMAERLRENQRRFRWLPFNGAAAYLLAVAARRRPPPGPLPPGGREDIAWGLSLTFAI